MASSNSVTTCSAQTLNELNNNLKPSEALYQQKCLAYADKQGDLSLIHLLEATPLGLFDKAFGKIFKKKVSSPPVSNLPSRWDPSFLNAPPFDLNVVITGATAFVPNGGQKNQLTLPGYSQFAKLNEDKIIVGKKPALDTYRFLKMFAAIVQKTQISPYIGKVHQFTASPDDLEKYVNKSGEGLVGGQFIGISREITLELVNNRDISKLLAALSLGVTSRVLYTGGERSLLEYMSAQPESSVQFHTLFERAYKLHNGDVYLTLLTLENTFSRWWRTANRENLMTTRKLANFTNSYLGKDDKYGAWYHFFGIALLGLVEGELANSIAEMESEGSTALNKINNRTEDESQESIVNAVGANFGIRLALLMKDVEGLTSQEKISKISQKYNVQSDIAMQQALTPGNYLILDEDFRDRLIMTPSPELQARATSETLSLSYHAGSLKNCHVEIFPTNAQTGVRDSALLQHFSASLTSTAQQYHATQWKDAQVSLLGARVIVSGCQELGEKVLVAEAAN